MGKVKLFLLTSSLHPILFFLYVVLVFVLFCFVSFAPMVAATSLLYSRPSTKALLSINNCLHWCVCGEDGRKLLFGHFTDLTPQ